MQEMCDEAEPQTLRDCRSLSKKMVLGGKLLQCKVCFHMDASDPKAGASTIDVSNIVLKSLKKKCGYLHHHETYLGTHVSKDNMNFSSSE